MSIEEYLFASFLAWRLMKLIAQEPGPYNLLGRFREIIGIRLDPQRGKVLDTELARLISCPKCFSVWLGWGAAFGYRLITGTTVQWIDLAVGLVISAGVLFIDVIYRRLGG